MIKAFQYRLYPTSSQRKTMESTVETCRRFSNDCLAERKDAYEDRKESIGKFAQLRKVKVLKETNPYAKKIHSHVLQVTVADLDEADATLELAFSNGVNPVDVAACYCEAKLRVGDWIKHHGRIFFLATKTGERTAAKAREEIHCSLERLQMDQVDLIQLHYLLDLLEWETALGTSGTLKDTIQALD